MQAQALGQYTNVQPPELGKIIAITLDATSRVKDLHNLALGGAVGERGGTMYLTMQSDVAFFFAFGNASGGTILETSADAAAASPITFRADACARVAAGEIVRVRVDRVRHRYLYLKGSGAGIFRAWVSSEGTTR